MAEPSIRPATTDDWMQFYERAPDVSVRAWVADMGGRILAVAGVRLPHGGEPAVYFSDMKPEMGRYRKAIVRGATLMLRETRERRAFATADDDIPGAPETLRHFGFRQVAAQNIWERTNVGV